jgi:DNA-binding NarL/FixJ family response regulator
VETYLANPPNTATTRPPVRVLICDDHEVVREGLRTLLAGRTEMRVVAEAGTAADAIEAAVRETPDVVIMDVRLPDGSGVEACRSIREILPATRVIMLTSYPDDEALYASIIAGASGYLLKQTRARALVEAIDTVSKGGALLDPDVTARVLDRVRRGRADEDPALASLTDQERRVLEQLATGKTNREIGEALFLSEKTIKNYVSRILEKLGLHRRAEAAAFAARRGMQTA